MIVGNDELSEHEAQQLLRMFVNDCREFAGVFHGENRSAKFRANWPDEYAFADSEWRNFVEAVLMLYTQALADPKRSPDDKRAMYLAMCLYHMASAQAAEHYTGEQLLPGSEKFEGSRSENRRISDAFGDHSMSFAELALPGKRFQ